MESSEFSDAAEEQQAAHFNGGSFISHELGSAKRVLHIVGGPHTEAFTMTRTPWNTLQAEISFASQFIGFTSGPPFYDVADTANFRYLGGYDGSALALYLSQGPSSWKNATNRFDVNNDGQVNNADLTALNNKLPFPVMAVLLTQARATNDPFADVNGDYVLSIHDVWELADELGQQPINPSPLHNYVNPFDVNADGTVNQADLTALDAVMPKGYNRAREYPLANFQEIHVRGHQGNDWISSAFNASSIPMWLFGGAGNDSLFADGYYNSSTLVGGAVTDWIYGGDGDDGMGGIGGNDVLFGEGGADLLYGTSNGVAAGADWLYGGVGTDTIQSDASDHVFQEQSDAVHISVGDWTGARRRTGVVHRQPFGAQQQALYFQFRTYSGSATQGTLTDAGDFTSHIGTDVFCRQSNHGHHHGTDRRG